MTIIITDDDVKRLLPMPDCIEAMRVAFRDFADGSAVNRPRMRYLAQHPDPRRKYLANVHVGAVPSAGIACVRAGSQIITPPRPGNDRRLYENPQAFNWGIVILYSIETAEPLALMHEFQLSGMRVGATTAVGVDAVARPDATTLGLFGTGKQARNALEAIAVRPLRRVNVYSPAQRRQDFAREMARAEIGWWRLPTPRRWSKVPTLSAAPLPPCRRYSTAIGSRDGQMVVSIANSDVTNKRSEVDRRTYERANAIIINDWESVIDNDQTELTDPLAQGVIRRQIHELGDLLIGKTRIAPPASGGDHLLQEQFRPGDTVCGRGQHPVSQGDRGGNNKTIPTEWLGATCPLITRPAFDLRLTENSDDQPPQCVPAFTVRFARHDSARDGGRCCGFLPRQAHQSRGRLRHRRRYDLYARMLGRFMGDHIQGKPTIIAQNMPGAGSWGRQLALQGGPQGRHRDRDRPDHAHRPGAGPARRAVRRAQVQLDRQYGGGQ